MATEKETYLTLIVLDFETGGLSCQECAATQISMHAVRLDTFETVDTLNLYIKPYVSKETEIKPVKKVVKTKYEIEEEEEESKEHLMTYDQEALNVSGITMDMLYSRGEELKEVCDKILSFIKDNRKTKGMFNKVILGGQNILFDINFLQQIMTYTGKYDKLSSYVDGTYDYFGNFQPYYIDTILLSKLTYAADKSISSHKLEVLAERLGIDMDDAHDADADVTATQAVIQALASRLRNNQGEATVTSSQKKEKMRDHFKI